MHGQLYLSVNCPLQGASPLTQGWVDTALMGPPPVSAFRTRLIYICATLYTYLCRMRRNYCVCVCDSTAGIVESTVGCGESTVG